MRYRVTLRPTTPREKLIATVKYLFSIGLFWLCSVIFPSEITIDGFGTLIVVSSLYYILTAVAYLTAFMLGCRLTNSDAIPYLIVVAVALVIGIPILLLFNQFINGFWISDAWSAFLISFIILVITSIVGTIIDNL